MLVLHQSIKGNNQKFEFLSYAYTFHVIVLIKHFIEKNLSYSVYGLSLHMLHTVYAQTIYTYLLTFKWL